MEVTCIDGEPTFFHKARVFYLKNFKQFVIEKTLQERRSFTLLKELSKFVLTVGLSGFLILVFTLFKEDIDDQRNHLKYEYIASTLDDINRASTTILLSHEKNNKYLKAISKLNNENKEELEQVNIYTSEVSRLLTESLSQLKKINMELKEARIKSITTKNQAAKDE